MVIPIQAGSERGEVESREGKWEFTDGQSTETGRQRGRQLWDREKGWRALWLSMPLLCDSAGSYLQSQRQSKLSWRRHGVSSITEQPPGWRNEQTCTAGIIILVWDGYLFCQCLTVKRKSVHSLFHSRTEISTIFFFITVAIMTIISFLWADNSRVWVHNKKRLPLNTSYFELLFI